ncbi:MAG: MinD/ParA family protein [Myxococcota bacterium]
MEKVGDQAAGLRVVRNPGHPRTGLRPLQKKHTRTYAVTSGKGGVGKTQVAANLAVAMAEEGARVALFDADLGLASLDLALGVRPAHDLLSVLRGERTIREIITPGPAGVSLMPACPGRYEMANLGPRERGQLCTAVEEIIDEFDVLIIDTGAGIGSNAVSFAGWADEIILVATTDPTSIRDAYAMSKVLHVRGGIDRIHLVANQVHGEREGVELHDRLESIVSRFLTLDLRYLGAIPADEAVRDAVTLGAPFVQGAPKSPGARAVRALATRLTPQAPRTAAC